MKADLELLRNSSEASLMKTMDPITDLETTLSMFSATSRNGSDFTTRGQTAWTSRDVWQTQTWSAVT